MFVWISWRTFVHQFIHLCCIFAPFGALCTTCWFKHHQKLYFLYLTDKCTKSYNDKSNEKESTENGNKISECVDGDWNDMNKYNECAKKYPSPCQSVCDLSQEDKDSCQKCHDDNKSCFDECYKKEQETNCSKECGWDVKRVLHLFYYFQYILRIVHMHDAKTTKNQTPLVRYARIFYNKTVFQNSVWYFFDQVVGDAKNV